MFNSGNKMAIQDRVTQINKFLGIRTNNNEIKNQDLDSLFKLPLIDSSSTVKITDKAKTDFSPNNARQKLSQVSETEWLKRGETRALKLFKAASRHVPAYKDFLKTNQINPESIHTMNDFKNVPTVDKNNYLRKYPVEQLAWHGKLSSAQMISVSSGSSGEPFFWPRGHILDAETALEHELFLSTFFELDKKSTLFIVCFAMGMYVAGPITMNSLLHMSHKGYPVTVVTPGYNPEDVLRIIPELADKYDQIVMAGYPPYVKEILDQGKDSGIDWEQIRLRFLLAGEGFNESWRSHVTQLVGKKDPGTDFLNLYGSADAAVLAFETNSSISIRRVLAENSEQRKKIFSDERLPSFLQYHPESKFFEVENEELILTTSGGIPLIRYNIHDRGGIVKQSDILNASPESKKILSNMNSDNQLWNLPYVYVFGKSDQTVILYGANVYPENIRRALENEGLRQYCSGKMIMYAATDENHDQRMHIDIECSNGHEITRNLTQKITRRILETLLEVNSEFRVVNGGIGQRTVPIVHLFKHGHKKFRTDKIKHCWALKEIPGTK